MDGCDTSNRGELNHNCQVLQTLSLGHSRKFEEACRNPQAKLKGSLGGQGLKVTVSISNETLLLRSFMNLFEIDVFVSIASQLLHSSQSRPTVRQRLQPHFRNVESTHNSRSVCSILFVPNCKRVHNGNYTALLRKEMTVPNCLVKSPS